MLQCGQFDHNWILHQSFHYHLQQEASRYYQAAERAQLANIEDDIIWVGLLSWPEDSTFTI